MTGRKGGTSASDFGRRARVQAYLSYFRLTGRRLGPTFGRFISEDRARTAHLGVPDDLGRMLRHAATKVPYYQPFLQGAAAELQSHPIDALARLPILDKETIRTNFDALCSSDLARRRTYQRTSGGSTGEPVQLIQGMDFRDHDNAVQWLMSSWAGWKPGEREVVVVGSPKDILERGQGFQASVASRLMRQAQVNAFRMDAASIVDCLEDLDQNPARLIRGYSQSLTEIAGYAEREGISVAPQHSIISTAAMLYPQMRERIERVFGCPVFDQYGTREASGVGGECEYHRGLHVFPWMNYVEIVDDDGLAVEPGEEGRVLLTSLCNFAMPLLRYEIGDRAAFMPTDAPPCRCGRGGQRLAGVLGRTVDTFKALDGSLVHGAFFISLLDGYDSIDRFQVIQQKVDRIVVRIAESAVLDGEAKAEIARGARKVIGDECDVEFEMVEEIAPSPSGKYRYTISEC